MGKKSLGIDIGDGEVTGVALEQRGKSLAVIACRSLPLPEGCDVTGQIRQLCEQLDWREGVCIYGLPLSLLSVRNLALPFRDIKKIAQTLPFELEEQLIAPVDTLVADFFLSQINGPNSLIVAFAVEKAFLDTLIEGVREWGDPDIITPAVVPLAAQVVRHNREIANLLLVHADLHSLTIVLILGGRPIFFRKLSYPEQMILHPPFSFDKGQVVVTDRAAAEQCIQLIGESITGSLDYFRVESTIESRPEGAVLSGPLAELEAMAGILTSTLNIPVETMDLLTANKIDCSDEVRNQWQSQRFNRAASLALLGLVKKAEINFRKEAFTKKRTLFSSRKQLLGGAAAAAVMMGCFFFYLWNDCRVLQNSDKAVRDEMTAIFKQTFPKVTKVHEPYSEMQAALKSVQGPGSPAPLFASDKRALGLLADISTRIPETVFLRVSRLAIDRETVLIKGRTDTFNSVDTIKSSLSASSRYKAVQIVSATADKVKKNGSIRFEIQLRLEEI